MHSGFLLRWELGHYTSESPVTAADSAIIQFEPRLLYTVTFQLGCRRKKCSTGDVHFRQAQ